MPPAIPLFFFQFLKDCFLELRSQITATDCGKYADDRLVFLSTPFSIQIKIIIKVHNQIIGKLNNDVYEQDLQLDHNNGSLLHNCQEKVFDQTRLKEASSIQ